MVRIRGLKQDLDRGIGKALGRRETSDDDNDALSSEGLPHMPVGRDKRPILFKLM